MLVTVILASEGLEIFPEPTSWLALLSLILAVSSLRWRDWETQEYRTVWPSFPLRSLSINAQSLPPYPHFVSLSAVKERRGTGGTSRGLSPQGADTDLCLWRSLRKLLSV